MGSQVKCCAILTHCSGIEFRVLGKDPRTKALAALCILFKDVEASQKPLVIRRCKLIILKLVKN